MTNKHILARVLHQNILKHMDSLLDQLLYFQFLDTLALLRSSVPRKIIGKERRLLAQFFRKLAKDQGRMPGSMKAEEIHFFFFIGGGLSPVEVDSLGWER